MRFLTTLALALFIPAVALAETDWYAPGNSVSPSNSISANGVRTFRWTVNTADSKYLWVGGCNLITFRVNPNTATGDLYGCTANTATRANDCLTLDADTDGDNVPDDNTMDGSNKALIQWSFAQVPGWVVFDPTSAAGEVSVACGQ